MNPQEEKIRYVKKYGDCEKLIWEAIHSLESRNSYYARKMYDEAERVCVSRDEHPLENYFIQKSRLDEKDVKMIEVCKKEQEAIRDAILGIPIENWKDCIWDIYIKHSDIATFSQKKGISTKTANRWMKQGLQALVIK